MKNKKITFLILTFSFLVSLLVTSCDIKSPVDGVELRVKTLARTTVASLSIYDATSGNLIQPDEVTVTFQGKDGGKIITLTNDSLTSAITTSGIINFAVSESIIPTSETPVEITVVVIAPNYISSSAQIFIASPGASSHSIALANVNNTPSGVVSNETNGRTDDNGTTDDIVASSGEDPKSGASATLTIPKETILKGKDGTILIGDVKARVTYFNPQDEQSLNSFPGGFAVNSGTERGSFVTAGFVAIDMTVGGIEVDKFSSNVNIQIDIPAGLTNPETGNPLVPGEKIPLWSYDETTGKWTKEGEVTVPNNLAKTTNGKSNYRVSFAINHLSYWNLDWFQDACYEGITINVVGSCYPNLRIKAKRASDGLYFYNGWISGNDRLVHLYNAPKNVPVIVELWDVSVYPSSKIAEMPINDLCGTNVDFPITQQSSLTEVTATASIVCHNSDGDVKSRFYPNNYPLYMHSPTNSNWSNIGQILDGQITTCLELGTTYTFGTYIDGNWVEYSYAVNTTNFVIEFSDLDPKYGDDVKDFCD